MIKAIFFDIDGTLLSHQTKQVPPSTIKAIKQLRKNNIYVFIATGRHSSEMAELPLQAVEVDGYISLNGQYCYNDQGIIYDLPIEKQDVKTIYHYITKHHLPCIFVEAKNMYINFNNETVQKVQDSISSSLPQVGDLKHGLSHPIYQIIPYDIDAKQEAEILTLTKHCKKNRWHDLAIDIMNKSGGKENGIKQILNHYSIKQEETMAFGDGLNDINMLQFVHTGIAMGNAKDEVKAIADDITDDVDQNGIYNALKKYHLI